MTPFEKRLQAAEARARVGDGEDLRVCIPPAGCPDVAAWERACEAQAQRDGVRQVIVVRFVSPADVRCHGETLQ